MNKINLISKISICKSNNKLSDCFNNLFRFYLYNDNTNDKFFIDKFVVETNIKSDNNNDLKFIDCVFNIDDNNCFYYRSFKHQVKTLDNFNSYIICYGVILKTDILLNNYITPEDVKNIFDKLIINKIDQKSNYCEFFISNEFLLKEGNSIDFWNPFVESDNERIAVDSSEYEKIELPYFIYTSGEEFEGYRDWGVKFLSSGFQGQTHNSIEKLYKSSVNKYGLTENIEITEKPGYVILDFDPNNYIYGYIQPYKDTAMQGRRQNVSIIYLILNKELLRKYSIIPEFIFEYISLNKIHEISYRIEDRSIYTSRPPYIKMIFLKGNTVHLKPCLHFMGGQKQLLSEILQPKIDKVDNKVIQPDNFIDYSFFLNILKKISLLLIGLFIIYLIFSNQRPKPDVNKPQPENIYNPQRPINDKNKSDIYNYIDNLNKIFRHNINQFKFVAFIKINPKGLINEIKSINFLVLNDLNTGKTTEININNSIIIKDDNKKFLVKNFLPDFLDNYFNVNELEIEFIKRFNKWNLNLELNKSTEQKHDYTDYLNFYIPSKLTYKNFTINHKNFEKILLFNNFNFKNNTDTLDIYLTDKTNGFQKIWYRSIGNNIDYFYIADQNHISAIDYDNFTTFFDKYFKRNPENASSKYCDDEFFLKPLTNGKSNENKYKIGKDELYKLINDNLEKNDDR